MNRIIPSTSARFCRGLTLGEMLVVLAVFSMLAIIFIFSSQDALTRTRYSRVLQDQNYLMQGLNEYEASRNGLPTQAEGLGALTRGYGSHQAMLSDPFAQNSVQARQYEFMRDLSPRHLAVVVSVGPDGDSDVASALDSMRGFGLAGESRASSFSMTPEEAQEFIANYSYDPTNGSASSGDIISVYRK